MDNTKPISQVRIRAVKATDVPSRLRSLGDDPEAVQRLVNDPGFGVIVEFRFAYLAHLGTECQKALDAVDEILANIDSDPARTNQD
jgi:hypothetical protein